MVRPLVRLAAMFVATCSLAAAIEPAHACVILPVMRAGEPTPEELRAEERQRERIAQARRKQFRAGVHSGKIDSANGLAELLIPNVREWFADRSDCGPGGDGDGPTMPRADMIAAAFVGSELDGLDKKQLDRVVPAVFVRTALDDYNLACNVEFRARFADQLRRTLRRRERDAALLKLSNDGDFRIGYYRFTDVQRMRRPELQPPRFRPERGGKLLRDPSHPVTRTVDAFWSEAEPQLQNISLVCPTAHRELLVAREAALQKLRQRRNYPELRKLADEGRRLRGP
jgi:hypothetical protein